MFFCGSTVCIACFLYVYVTYADVRFERWARAFGSCACPRAARFQLYVEMLIRIAQRIDGTSGIMGNVYGPSFILFSNSRRVSSMSSKPSGGGLRLVRVRIGGIFVVCFG